ncbi:MAG TPA: alkaline phosphatase family protein [Gemmatimonadaceae bacterium]|nr:alkaline phosphatase family protein [Gemmatimonadaceae bacterium]
MLKFSRILPVLALAAAPLRAQGTPPTLVVMITIDGFAERNLEKFLPQMRGGLARLANGGAWFTNAHHDHGITETAPGHATLLAGRFPRSTGIAANRAGVYDPDSPLDGFSGGLGASPKRFQGTTVTDWLVTKDPRARALSVSSKDRAAILPIGRSKQQVYWYPGDGDMTTSKYYADTVPTWVSQFNARRIPAKATGKTWSLLLAPTEYTEPDSVAVESNGTDFVFPHSLPPDTAATETLFWTYPFGDELLAAFALEGVQAMNLGKGPQTDLLAVSFSANDAVSHRFGPDSREAHDQLLRADRTIGMFLDSLFKLRDPSKIVIALSGDHGFGTAPELAKNLNPPPTRVSILPALVSARQRLAKLHVDTMALEQDVQVTYVNRDAFAKAKVNPDEVLRPFREDILKTPGVARVDRFADLLKGDTINDRIVRRWSHQFPPDAPIEFLITLTPGSLWRSPLVASHGTPYDYDTNVPVVFYGPPFKAGRFTDFVRTVDIAPTLASAAFVNPTEKLDGVVLKQAMK